MATSVRYIFHGDLHKEVLPIAQYLFCGPLHHIYLHIFSDIDECKNSPCKNGATCQDGNNTYTCQCADGFEGKNCLTSKSY